MPWAVGQVSWPAEALSEEDPDLRCFRVAREMAARSQNALPPVLAAFADRADLAERLAERDRSQVLAAVLDWADRRGETPARQLRVVLALVEAEDGPAVALEARVSSPRRRDAPRTQAQLDQLRGECQRTPGLLASEERALLELLVRQRGAPSFAGERTSPGVLARLLERFGGSPLVAWDAALPEGLAQRFGVAAEAPVRLAREVVRIVPDLAAAAEPRLELVVAWPDGRKRALADALFLPPRVSFGNAEPGFVLVEGAFHALGESLPQALVERFSARGGLPLQEAELAPVLQRLLARLPHLRESAAARTRHHRVTPLLLVDLLGEEWLELRLLAHDAPAGTQPAELRERAARVFEWLPERGFERWPGEQGDPTQARPAEVPGIAAGEAGFWLEGPEPTDVAPAVEWLAGLGAAPNASRATPPAQAAPYPGLRLRATAKSLEAFADAFERRPERISVFATPRALRLLDPDLRVFPRLTVAASGIDFFEVSAAWESEGLALSEDEIALLRAATTRFVRLGSGWVRREAAADVEGALDALADLGIEPGDPAQRVSLWQLAGSKPESLDTLERLAGSAELASAARELRERVARFAGLPETPLPAGLAGELRPYQRRGLDFLAHTSSLGLGAILADDMGLGKTVQALAWLLRLREDGARGPALVVCPTSVVHNWVREAERFAPSLRVGVLGRGAERHRLRAEIDRFDLVVTNYALLRRDAEEWKKVDLLTAILDEAQNVKNPDAEVTRVAQALRARHRLALTGTPLENRALDLWSLMSFVNPGYLGARRAFARRYDQPDAPPERRRLLAAKLRPVLLRRLKQEVAPELPERIEERRDCELVSGQRKLYLAELRRSRRLVDALGEGDARLRAQGRIAILAALTRLRQICCHPALAGGGARLGSGKFEAFFELLEPLLAEGHKVLVFSQFVACLRLLRRELARRGVAVHELTGATTRRERVVAEFQEDPRPGVFLISLRAGGTGLNLTAASYVVLFDPWWNPAVEAQAIDRTHRIGQDRTVIAYRLLAAGTVEEKIFELQQRKAALTREILGESALGKSLTRDDLEYLFAEA